MTTQPEQILDDLTYNDGTYQREAIDAAIDHQDEMIPLLIGVLDKVMDNPDKYLDSYRRDHIYAYVLLGHLKVKEAHETIIDLFSMPSEIIDPLYGDMITELLPTVLWRTLDDDVEPLQELVADEEAYEYCRTAALETLSWAVVEEKMSREEMITFLQGQFASAEIRTQPLVMAFMCGLVLDLHLEPLWDAVREAFEANLVDVMMFGDVEIFEKQWKLGPEAGEQRLREKSTTVTLDELHEDLETWAMFEERLPMSDDLDEEIIEESAKRKKTPVELKAYKAKRKKRRKMAKATKRKQRKKKKK